MGDSDFKVAWIEVSEIAAIYASDCAPSWPRRKKMIMSSVPEEELDTIWSSQTAKLLSQANDADNAQVQEQFNIM